MLFSHYERKAIVTQGGWQLLLENGDKKKKQRKKTNILKFIGVLVAPREFLLGFSLETQKVKLQSQSHHSIKI